MVIINALCFILVMVFSIAVISSSLNTSGKNVSFLVRVQRILTVAQFL